MMRGSVCADENGFQFRGVMILQMKVFSGKRHI